MGYKITSESNGTFLEDTKGAIDVTCFEGELDSADYERLAKLARLSINITADALTTAYYAGDTNPDISGFSAWMEQQAGNTQAATKYGTTELAIAHVAHVMPQYLATNLPAVIWNEQTMQRALAQEQELLSAKIVPIRQEQGPDDLQGLPQSSLSTESINSDAVAANLDIPLVDTTPDDETNVTNDSDGVPEHEQPRWTAKSYIEAAFRPQLDPAWKASARLLFKDMASSMKTGYGEALAKLIIDGGERNKKETYALASLKKQLDLIHDSGLRLGHHKIEERRIVGLDVLTKILLEPRTGKSVPIIEGVKKTLLPPPIATELSDEKARCLSVGLVGLLHENYQLAQIATQEKAS